MSKMPKPPKAMRVLALLASIVSGLGAIACLWIALTGAASVLWASVGFLVIMLVAAAIGVLAGLGRFASGYGMACLSIAATIAGGSIFAWRDLASNVGRDPQIGPLLLPWRGIEIACALVILAAGGFAVLSRRAASWKSIVRAGLFLVPAGAMLIAAYFGLDKIAATDSGRVIALGLLLVGGAVLIALVSLGGHHLIRAFELTADDPNGTRM